jgi:hypothetical protein
MRRAMSVAAHGAGPAKAKQWQTDTRISSVAALVMARAQKQLAEEYDDADLALNAIRLERPALEAIELHLPELRDAEKPAE